MANKRDPDRTLATNRVRAAQAILEGYADADVATVMVTAAAAGFVFGKVSSYDRGGTVS